MLNIIKRLSLLLAALLISLPNIYAQDWEDDGPSHWMADLSGGLNTDGYEADISVSWWPVSGFGFRLALGMAGEIEPIEYWDWGYDDYDYGYYDDNVYAMRIKLMPSLMLRSPSLLNINDDATSFHLFANPGICLAPGAAGSRDAAWFSWQLRGGLELDIDEIVLQLGYGYSNFNLYSGDPYSYHGTPEERDRRTHSVFLSCGIRF